MTTPKLLPLQTTTLALGFFGALTLLGVGFTARGATSPDIEPTILATKMPAGDPPRLFAFTYSTESGVKGELRLNGVVMAEFSGKGSSGSTNRPQLWLMPGRNRLELAVLLDAKGAKVAATQPLVQVRLHGLAEPGIPDESNTMLSVALAPEVRKAGQRIREAYEFALDQAPPAELWSRAAKLEAVEPADRQVLIGLANQLVAAFKAKDAEVVTRLLRFVREDSARAMGEPAKLDPADIAEQVKLWAPVAKRLPILKPAMREVQLVGDGRVVRLAQRGGQPCFVTPHGGGKLSLELYFAKLDGAWALVR